LLLDGWMKMEGIMGLRKAPPSLEAHHWERVGCEGFAKVLHFIIYYFDWFL
jgi:hypothetical protein